MTEPSARILLDSISPSGHRLTTMEVTMHRFVLAEFNTHRVFSRNSASSRAIPVAKQLERFTADPARFVSWNHDLPGMQGGIPLEGQDLIDAMQLENNIRTSTASLIQDYLERHPGRAHQMHKSRINRFMEWGQFHTAIVSSTEWENFFNQRCSPLAEPEMQAVAYAMRDALLHSDPTPVKYGDWHLPLIQPDEQIEPLHVRKAVSVARCARVSYLTHEGKRDLKEDMRLFQRLVTANPPHWSPLEHVAVTYSNPYFPGNFEGWHQLRHQPRETRMILLNLNTAIGPVDAT